MHGKHLEINEKISYRIDESLICNTILHDTSSETTTCITSICVPVHWKKVDGILHHQQYQNAYICIHYYISYVIIYYYIIIIIIIIIIMYYYLIILLSYYVYNMTCL